MNPHRLTWGFAFDFPFAQVIAVVTLVSIAFCKEKKELPWTPTTIVWLIFILWMGLTTLFSLNPNEALIQFEKVIKIQLMAFVTLLVMGQREKITALVWVIVASIGFYGVKGGVYAIKTGGVGRVWGPPGGFIEGNNELGLALIMILPLMLYLQQRVEKPILRWVFTVAMLLIGLAILTTHSRGAFLALGIMLLYMWFKSRKKLMLGMAILLVVPIAIKMMPEEWVTRMETIKTYEEDTSAMGRLNAWKFAYEMASQRLTGGGYGSFLEENYWRFSPQIAVDIDAGDGFYQGAHSIYFSVLGEHGFVGLFLFIILGILAFLSGNWVIRQARGHPELTWAKDLAAMLQVSLVGYAIGGAFLALAYFDLFYHLVVLLMLLKYIVDKQLNNNQRSLQNDRKQSRDTGIPLVPNEK